MTTDQATTTINDEASRPHVLVALWDLPGGGWFALEFIPREHRDNDEWWVYEIAGPDTPKRWGASGETKFARGLDEVFRDLIHEIATQCIPQLREEVGPYIHDFEEALATLQVDSTHPKRTNALKMALQSAIDQRIVGWAR